MDFNLPPDLVAYLEELDEFIESVIKPLENRDDNVRFFDHRREDARALVRRRKRPLHPKGLGDFGKLVRQNLR